MNALATAFAANRAAIDAANLAAAIKLMGGDANRLVALAEAALTAIPDEWADDETGDIVDAPDALYAAQEAVGNISFDGLVPPDDYDGYDYEAQVRDDYQFMQSGR